ncbi:MAG: DNA repair protein RecN [Actinomycetota bacterium]|nr:MAG: DNA repair protein RecN [Actinomycetota bacterium]
MIEELRIRGLGVIEDAVVEPAAGLTVLSGETGAGKTMVVTALALLLGGRVDGGTVRSAGDGEPARAEVEGRVRAGGLPAVLARVEDAGGHDDEGCVLLARTVSSEGRSRAFLGGRSVPATVLAEVADDLIAIHGQDDQRRLLAPARQRAALDRYAGDAVGTPLAAYTVAYSQLREVSAELDRIVTAARERVREADLLRHGLAEIDAAAPLPAEDAELAAEARRLSQVESLRENAVRAHDALRSDGTDPAADAVTLLVQAGRSLASAGKDDPVLTGLADRLTGVAAEVDDIAADLAGYLAGLEADPLRLAAVEERRAVLGSLRRRYGDTVDDVIAWAAAGRSRLAELDGDDDRVQELTGRRDDLRAALACLAAQLSEARRRAADRLADAVSVELTQLAMPHARLQVSLTRTPDEQGLAVAGEASPVAFGPTGTDEVAFLLAPHPGAPLRPLARGASGGELSRVMLAVEVVFAGSDLVPTYVFDEVDAGVGGAAAVEIGRRLARLARDAQVLVVTHLPQVAAFAERHLAVRKSDDGRVTTSSVEVLDQPGRVRELARMLAGLEGSAAAASHATELLELAAAERVAQPGPQPSDGATAARRSAARGGAARTPGRRAR